MHKNRTASGIAKEQEHDRRYKSMLIGKTTTSGDKITNAEYIGNAVYGIVKIYFEDGTHKLVSHPHAFRPRKIDFNLSE